MNRLTPPFTYEPKTRVVILDQPDGKRGLLKFVENVPLVDLPPEGFPRFVCMIGVTLHTQKGDQQVQGEIPLPGETLEDVIHTAPDEIKKGKQNLAKQGAAALHQQEHRLALPGDAAFQMPNGSGQ